MLSRNPASLRWRQALPVLFVFGIIILGLLSIWSTWACLLFSGYLGMYLIITLFAGIVEAVRNKDTGLVLGFPLALWTMHLSWGFAFIWAILSRVLWRRRGSR